jgi:hypothetical protein
VLPEESEDSTELDGQLSGMQVDLSQTDNGTGNLLMKKPIEFIRGRNFERAEVSLIAANSGARHF